MQSNMHTINNGPCTNNKTHEHITPSKGLDSNQINKEAHSEEMIIDKSGMVNRDDEDKSKDSVSCIRMRFGRIIRKPGRLAY